MDYVNRAEQAVDGLDVTAAGGVVVVEDGHTKWLCPEASYDAAYASLAKLPPLKDEDDTSEAYDQLCNRIWTTCAIAVQDQEGHSGTQEARQTLIRQALDADLIDAKTARRMGLQ